jgi:hypothetical protein
MTLYDIEKGTMETKDVRTTLDIRNMVAYKFDGCYNPPTPSKSSSEPTSDPHRNLEIILPTTLTVVAIVAIVSFLVIRHRRRRHYHAITSHHQYHN